MDFGQGKIIIVVPCYNEAKRLDSDQFLSYARRNGWVSFLFVNDGSTDETATLLQRLCKELPDLLFKFDLKKNQGKSEAVRLGFLKSFQRKADFIGYWDADLSTPLEDIGRLRKILVSRRANLIMGSRVRLLGRHIERQPTRHYLGRMFATTASMILGLPVYDTQCGAKFFRVTEELKKVFSKPFVSKWVFDVEIIARFLILEKAKKAPDGTFRRNTIEYPLETWVDVRGSKIVAGDYLRAAADLARIYRLLRMGAF